MFTGGFGIVSGEGQGKEGGGKEPWKVLDFNVGDEGEFFFLSFSFARSFLRSSLVNRC